MDIPREGPLPAENENQDSPSSALAVPSDMTCDFRHRRSSSKWNEELSPASSTVTESTQAGELISGSACGSKLPTVCLFFFFFPFSFAPFLFSMLNLRSIPVDLCVSIRRHNQLSLLQSIGDGWTRSISLFGPNFWTALWPDVHYVLNSFLSKSSFKNIVTVEFYFYSYFLVFGVNTYLCISYIDT